MRATDREIWLLNFYRNSELHGALFMGKLARNVREPHLIEHLTRHCATEARHAAMLTEALVAIGAALDPGGETIQNHYAAEGGVPKELADWLVLSEVLEHRVLASYQAHLEREDVHPRARATLHEIVQEMKAEGEDEHAGWIERVLERQPPELVKAAEIKWRAIDERVAAALHGSLDKQFP